MVQDGLMVRVREPQSSYYDTAWDILSGALLDLAGPGGFVFITPRFVLNEFAYLSNVLRP